MYEFSYSRPATLADALAGLASDDDAVALAGGMTLIPSMKHRLSAPSQLLDIAALPELQGITFDLEVLTVGAASRHAQVAADETVNQHIPALANLANAIGDPQVRVRGTLGGSLANNDPAADYPAAVLGLDGLVHTDRRQIAADDFFQGMFTTALEPGELICKVAFRKPQRCAYAKFHHPASGYAMTGVMVANYGNAVRVAVTGAAPCVFRWTQAEQALSQRFAASAIDGLTMPADGLNADLHAPASYRANLVKVMTGRAVAACTA